MITGFVAKGQSIHTVSSNADSGAGTLRNILELALNNDTIEFDLVYPDTISLTSGPIIINKNLTLKGPGALNLTINLDGDSVVFKVGNIGTVGISNLTIYNSGSNWPTGIYNEGVLTISSSILNGNYNIVNGDGLFYNSASLSISSTEIFGYSGSPGCGIVNWGTMDIILCNIFNSEGESSQIYNNGTLSISSSSITDNKWWHGILNLYDGELNIFNSTISENTSLHSELILNRGKADISFSTFSNNKGIYSEAIRSYGIFTTSNSIYQNTKFINYWNVISKGYNMSSDSSYRFDNVGDFNNISNLNLAPLQDNGGSTFTHALEFCSAAIDAADPDSSGNDQRGEHLFGGRRDIGAYERQSFGGVVPAAPSVVEVSPQFLCDPGAFSLSVYSNEDSLIWYGALSGNNVLGSGDSFTTPVLNSTTSFWVSTHNGTCPSIRREIVAPVIDIDTTNTVSGITIFSNEYFAEYQWLDCDNNYVPLVGQTYQSFKASVNGTYAVEIEKDGCKDTSACTFINSVSLDEKENKATLIYPNPFKNQLTIDLDNRLVGKRYFIFDGIGKLVLTGTLLSKKTNLNLSDLNKGLYVFKIDELPDLSVKVIRD